MERVGGGVTLTTYPVYQSLAFVGGLKICLTRGAYNFFEAKFVKIISHCQSRENTKHVSFVALIGL
jgi:hypothetical protein